jgi:hypothetical protein
LKHPEDEGNTFFRKFVDFYRTRWHRIPEDITATAMGPQNSRSTSFTTFSSCVHRRNQHQFDKMVPVMDTSWQCWGQ